MNQRILCYSLVVLITHKINYPNTYFEYLLFRHIATKPQHAKVNIKNCAIGVRLHKTILLVF